MTNTPEILAYSMPKPASRSGTFFTKERAKEALAFHRTIPGYAPTPLQSLSGLAKQLGVRAFYVKDESPRFGLNAFKSLGGSFAAARVLAKRLGIPEKDLAYPALVSPEAKAKTAGLTLVTATDGNHGRGVAWAARMLGLRAVVYLPAGTAPERVENIRAQGAEAVVTDLVYDDAVRLAARKAREEGWILVQDTSWAGYEEIPRLIMQGYETMGLEIAQALGSVRPTHVFLQAGVGSMAGAMAGFFSDLYGEAAPEVGIVEPLSADCCFRTAKAGDGRLHGAPGPMKTIMAGLACGEVCSEAWKELEALARHYFAVSDAVAETGMRRLAAPLPGDPRIVSGESGASTAGLAIEILGNPEFRAMKEAMGLGPDSVVLCLSTEGATDRGNWRRIVGAEP